MQDELDQLADCLDDLAEQLADLGMNALRAAIEDSEGDGSRPEIEKRISRARRGVAKAAVVLRDPR